MIQQKTTQKIEFGDFQTPLSLARKVCQLLKTLGYSPASILEPTCGEGSFIIAALEIFKDLQSVSGFDINPDYASSLESQFRDHPLVTIRQTDFFNTDWPSELEELADPLLILGNPPWVTNSELASIDGNNLPKKINFQNHSGLDALTGASNFDISEWMLLKMFDWVRDRNAVVAMLCKTAVARKVLLQEWKNRPASGLARIFTIDALTHFDASVDACLLVYDSTKIETKQCDTFSDLTVNSKTMSFGYDENQLIANMNFYKKWKQLRNNGAENNDFRWRSGIKHDCSKVMELTRTEGGYVNNLGERVDIEDSFVYPMLKSSDLANGASPSRFMLVTQKFIGQKTIDIKSLAPKTWEYLTAHRHFFERRKSSIYKDRPAFSIFGVGDYSFSPWKVAISGLYKKLNFEMVGPYYGKPVMFDDTCYFLACGDEEEARIIAQLLNSPPAQEFFSAFIFWDAKRPITAKILKKLNIVSLVKTSVANDKFSESEYQTFFSRPEQLPLFEHEAKFTT